MAASPATPATRPVRQRKAVITVSERAAARVAELMQKKAASPPFGLVKVYSISHYLRQSDIVPIAYINRTCLWVLIHPHPLGKLTRIKLASTGGGSGSCMGGGGQPAICPIAMDTM